MSNPNIIFYPSPYVLLLTVHYAQLILEHEFTTLLTKELIRTIPR